MTAVEHAVVEQGAKRRPLGRVGVTVIVVITGNVRPMAMVQHSDYPWHAHCLRMVDGEHPTTGDGTAHDAAMEQPGLWVFTCVARLPCNLGDAVHAVQGRADYGCGVDHGVVPPAAAPSTASLNARTIARCASVTLKPLWLRGCAPCSRVCAAWVKSACEGAWPASIVSTTVSRHGLWATPPSASRACWITPPSRLKAAATDTSANA
ncbi:hypothetical protein D3C79_842520 [compost metagenome]